jgi:hypothetical protein
MRAVRLEGFSDLFRVSDFRFVPLICNCLALGCDLDIVWLHRETPHRVVQHGDIDRRLVTLFDALRMPKIGPEVSGLKPDSDEDPFFCLLEDDSLITDVRVTSDHLLTPPPDSHPNTDAFILIRVKVKLVRAMEMNLGFA